MGRKKNKGGVAAPTVPPPSGSPSTRVPASVPTDSNKVSRDSDDYSNHSGGSVNSRPPTLTAAPGESRQSSPTRSYGTYQSVTADEESAERSPFRDNDEDVQIEDDFHPTGSFGSSCINISNTILGSGMLAMPSALAGIGLGLGIFLIGLSASAASFGLILLTEVAAKVGRDSSFNACAKITYPKAAVFFDIAIAVKCFGVSVSYLVICGELLPKVVDGIAPGLATDSLLRTKTLWVILSLALVSPLCFLRRLDSLRYTSAFALTAVVYLVFIVVHYFFTDDADTMPPRPTWESIRWFNVDSHFFGYLPIFVFAFTCHQNIFSVYNELVDNSPPRVKGVVLTSIGTAFSVYELVAILGYLTFGNAVSSNIIGQYPASPLITGGQLAIVFLVLLSYPLQCHPARASLDKIITTIRGSTSATHAPLTGNDEEDGRVLAALPGEIPLRKWIAMTLSLMSASLVLAAVVHDLGKVLAFVGATGSTTICYILPGAFYYKYSTVYETDEASEDLLPSSASSAPLIARAKKWRVKQMAALALSVFGVFVMVTSLATLASGKGSGSH